MPKFKNIVLLAKAGLACYLAYSFLYERSFAAFLDVRWFSAQTTALVDYYGRLWILFAATLLYLPKMYSARIALTLAFYAFLWYSKKSWTIGTLPSPAYLDYAFYAFLTALVVDFFVRYAGNDFWVEMQAYDPVGKPRDGDGNQASAWDQRWASPAYDTYGAPPGQYGQNGVPAGIVIPDSMSGGIGAPILGMDDLFSSGWSETPEELELMEEMNKNPDDWRIAGDKKVNPRNMACSQNYVLTERIFNEIA